MPEVEAGAAGRDASSAERFAGLRVRLGASSGVKVLDLSSDGAVLEARKYLRIGSLCTMAVKGAAGELSLDATVCWSRLIRTVAIAEKEVESIYRAGVAFVDLPQAKCRLLEGLIAAEVGSEPSEEPAGRDSRKGGSVLPFVHESERRARDAQSRQGFVRNTRETFDRLFGDEGRELERCADER